MEKKIGKVSRYFPNIGVAAFDLTDGPLSTGDSIHVVGPSTDLAQTVEEMQVDGEFVEKVEKGGQVGVKLDDMVKVGDDVYIVTMKGE